jgi:hypothetical protein
VLFRQRRSSNRGSRRHEGKANRCTIVSRHHRLDLAIRPGWSAGAPTVTILGVAISFGLSAWCFDLLGGAGFDGPVYRSSATGCAWRSASWSTA